MLRPAQTIGIFAVAPWYRRLWGWLLAQLCRVFPHRWRGHVEYHQVVTAIDYEARVVTVGPANTTVMKCANCGSVRKLALDE